MLKKAIRDQINEGYKATMGKSAGTQGN